MTVWLSQPDFFLADGKHGEQSSIWLCFAICFACFAERFCFEQLWTLFTILFVKGIAQPFPQFLGGKMNKVNREGTKIGPTLRWGSPSLPPLDMKNVHATHNQHVYVYMSWHQNSTSFHAWKTWASSTVYIWTLSSTEHINHHNSYACKRHDDSENMHLKVGVSVLNLSNNMSKQRVQLHTKSFVENTQLLFGGKRTEKQRGGASSKPIWISLCWLHFFFEERDAYPIFKVNL